MHTGKESGRIEWLDRRSLQFLEGLLAIGRFIDDAGPGKHGHPKESEQHQAHKVHRHSYRALDVATINGQS